VASSSAGNTAEEGDFDLSRSQAILVANSVYTAGFADEPIPAAINGLRAMHHLLVNYADWPVNRIAARVNPSRLAFQAEVESMIARVQDVLLIYYVGHGQTLAHPDEVGLAFSDTSTHRTDRRSTSWSFSQALGLMRASKAEVRIVILDCCYAGWGVQNLTWAHDVPESGRRRVPGAGLYILGACERHQKTSFEPGEQGMPFSPRR